VKRFKREYEKECEREVHLKFNIKLEVGRCGGTKSVAALTSPRPFHTVNATDGEVGELSERRP
jgi:hypothetical protein